MKPARLSVLDDMFYRGHHGRGTEVVMQGIWRFSDRIAPADLESFHALLAASSLTRRVVSPRFPWARRYFADDAVVAPLRCHPDVLGPGALVPWADAQGDTRLDVDAGPAWELALAHTHDGGSAVTLTCSHLVADGLGLVGTADHAIAGSSPTQRSSAPASSTPPRLRDDIADAVRLWFLVVVGVLRSLLRGCVDPATRSELFDALRPSAPASAGRPPSGRETTMVIEVDADQWDALVAGSGATSTALTTALAADLVVAVGGPGSVGVTVPMAGSGHSLRMAEISVDAPADPGSCAAQLRSAYHRAGVGAGLGPPGGMPEELLQLLGDRIAHAVVPDPGGRDALVSPLGDLGTAFDALGTHTSTGLAVRSVYPRRHPGLTDSSMLLGVWTARTCGRVVVSLVCRGDLDRPRFTEATVECFTQRGLDATPW